MKTLKSNYAFIDSQNLNLRVRTQEWVLDIPRYRVILKDKYSVKKAFLCIGYVGNNQMLYTFLQKSGYICVFKPTLEIKENGIAKIKGNVDAELVLHAMIERDNYEKAVIVSGDGDFHCLIEYLKENGKLKKIIVPNQRYSSLLRKFGDYIVNIQLFKEKLEIKNRPGKGG